MKRNRFTEERTIAVLKEAAAAAVRAALKGIGEAGTISRVPQSRLATAPNQVWSWDISAPG